MIAIAACLAVVAGAEPASAAGASALTLRATATDADGSTHAIRRHVSGISPRQVDVVRRTRSSVTLGYPSARVRRRQHVARCALITFRLRLNPIEGDPVERARQLVPAAEEEGSWTRAAAGSDGVDDHAGSRQVGAWRYHAEIVDHSRLIARGAAVADVGAVRKRGLAELTMRARMIRGGSLCGGLEESYFTFGIDELSPLRLFN